MVQTLIEQLGIRWENPQQRFTYQLRKVHFLFFIFPQIPVLVLEQGPRNNTEKTQCSTQTSIFIRFLLTRNLMAEEDTNTDGASAVYQHLASVLISFSEQHEGDIICPILLLGRKLRFRKISPLEITQLRKR